MSDIQHIDYRMKQQMRQKELETLRQKKFAKLSASIQTSEAENETRSPRAKNISAFLTSQTQSILEERRKQRSTMDRLQQLSPFAWPERQKNTDENTLTWKDILDSALEAMNKEIWQDEKRTVITDIQSIALLVTTTLFLFRFGPIVFRTTAFVFRRLSFPAACAYLICPVAQETSESGTSGIPSEITVNTRSSAE